MTGMRLDHLVLLVPDLDAATRQWSRRGFTVTPGGTHAEGHTHNALICLADGAYLELIAFRAPRRTTHRWDRMRPFPGLIDFAVRVNDIRATVAALARRGVKYSAPVEGGRARPDGITLRWRGAHPVDDSLGLPFLIEDVTARNLRVPAGNARRHTNGAIGVASLDVLTPSLSDALPAFSAVFGRVRESGRRAARFTAGSVLVTLRQPERGRAAALLSLRGAGPYGWTPAQR